MTKDILSNKITINYFTSLHIYCKRESPYFSFFTTFIILSHMTGMERPSVQEKCEMDIFLIYFGTNPTIVLAIKTIFFYTLSSYSRFYTCFKPLRMWSLLQKVSVCTLRAKNCFFFRNTSTLSYKSILTFPS